MTIANGEPYGSKSVDLFDIVDHAFIRIVRAAEDHLSNKNFRSEFHRTQFTAMARRGGKRGGTRMRMAKVTKKRAYCRRRKPVKKQQRKRKRDDDSEIEAAITRVKDYKGKKIKPDPSDVDTDAGTSLATSQDLQEFSDETSAGLAFCPSDSTPGKKETSKREDNKGKNKRKRKEKKAETSEASGDSKTTTEKTPARKSPAKKQRPNSKRRRSSQKGEDQTQITKGNESGKPSESAGSGNMNMNKNVPDPNNPQKGGGEATDAKEPCSDKAAPKDVVVEEQHEEESSSSSG